MDPGRFCLTCRCENTSDARFCSQCGRSLASTADNRFALPPFDERLTRIQRYLPQGLTEKILAQNDRFAGERRRVTVMFCDMAAYTPLVERVGAEAAYEIMGRIYEILIRHVHYYGGTINEMTGDGIMALFGAPVALEEASHRALWAAQAIHRQIERFNERNPDLGLRMRIGIHSGPVVVGALGNDLRMEFKAVGDTVNLASRMAHLAEPGSTGVSREVYKQSADIFAFQSLGKRFVKGLAQSIPVYKVLSGSRDMHRPRPGIERKIFARMVGRGNQLTRLTQQVATLIQGEGGVVNVIGEAGIGKTRLVTELKQQRSLRGVTVLEGRALSMGRNLSFHPLSDLLKAWAGIGEEDDEATAFGRLETALDDLFRNQSGDLLPLLATLMGIHLPATHGERVAGIDGDALEKLIRKSLREWMLRLSQKRPLIVVIEDLHWADQSSRELLAYLFRLVEQAPILFVNLFRPGYTAEPLLLFRESSAPHPLDIILEPLDDKASETLVEAMLGPVAGQRAVVQHIVQTAGGNPYFMEEVVRSLIEEGALVLKDAAFTVTNQFDRMPIPQTIHDVLMARIDRLEEGARDLLKVAAVIGRHFFYRILTAVADPVQTVDDRLAALKRSELILDELRFGELAYAFKHALVQETAYAMILPEQRRALHQRVAEAIETAFAGQLHAFDGLLAYHYGRAENLEKAEETLIRAGEAALKTSASSEALHYCREALGLYRRQVGTGADAAKVARLEKNIALAFFNRGQYEESIDYFDRALAYYWEGYARPTRPSTGTFCYGLVRFLTTMWGPSRNFRRAPSEKHREAVDLFYRKLKALGIIDPPRYFADSLRFYRGISGFDLSHFDIGYGLFVSASSLFSFSGLSFRISRQIMDAVAPRISRTDTRAFVIHDFVETLHHFLAGNWKAIKPVDHELVRDNLHVGEVYFASLHLHWHGLHYLHQGDLAQAERLIEQLDGIADIYENDFSQLLKLLLNTGLLLECRRLEDARAEIEAGIVFAKQIKSGLGLIHFYGCLAHLHLLMADDDGAEAALASAEAVRRELAPVPWQLAFFLRSRAELGLHRLQQALSKRDKAGLRRRRRQAHRACRALVRQTRKVAQFRTDACRLMGLYHWRTGHPRKACRWWRKAVGDPCRARIQLARTYWAIGSCLSEPHSPCAALDGIDAAAYREKAAVLFAEMNLEGDLQNMSAVGHRQFAT